MNSYDVFTQAFPPEPALTEASLPSQAGRIFAITGANAGVGFELARILYAAGGTVYAFNRNEKKSTAALQQIEKTAKTSTPGALVFIQCDLSDLAGVARAAAAFHERAARLDVLFLNAGVVGQPAERTAQGHELHTGVNCLGSYLLARLLTLKLAATAKTAPPSSVRVVWASSILVDYGAPEGGLDMAKVKLAETDPGSVNWDCYAQSKAGNWFLASEYHKRIGKEAGIVSVTQNPGNLKTDIWRNSSWWRFLKLYLFLYKPVFGAYTNLWAGFADDVNLANGGRYVIPWGRWHPHPKDDIANSIKSKAEGGTGVAAEFWEWCTAQAEEWL